MDMFDVFVVAFLEWLYGPIANRFGKLIASVVVLALTLAIVAASVWILFRIAS